MATMVANKIKGRITPGMIGEYTFWSLFSVMMAFPLYINFITAFKPVNEMNLWPPRWYVVRPTLTNFTSLINAFDLTRIPFTRFMFNSIFITVTVVLGSVIFASIGAYSIAKLKPPGAEIYRSAIIFSLMFVTAAVVIPTYMIIKSMGIINTYWAYIVPGLGGTFYFFMMLQFMHNVPEALLESARIDGAGEFRIFFTIAIPCLIPALATFIFMRFSEVWGMAGTDILYVQDESLMTLNYALGLVSAGGAAAAAALVSSLPAIVMFLITQPMVMQTMSHMGIKG